MEVWQLLIVALAFVSAMFVAYMVGYERGIPRQDYRAPKQELWLAWWDGTTPRVKNLVPLCDGYYICPTTSKVVYWSETLHPGAFQEMYPNHYCYTSCTAAYAWQIGAMGAPLTAPEKGQEK